VSPALLSIRALAVLTCIAIAPCACGGAQGEPETPAPSHALPAPVPLGSLPAGHVWRYDVMKVMSPGLGAFLQRIDVQEKMVDGKFHGWQVSELRGEPGFWGGVDLHNGDVITMINGQPIGHYDEAYRVWSSLATAPELVVSFERGQEARELRFVIHDEGEAGGGTPPVTPQGSGQPASALPSAPGSERRSDAARPAAK
jgi:hypothetical protein